MIDAACFFLMVKLTCMNLEKLAMLNQCTHSVCGSMIKKKLIACLKD